MVSFKDVSLIHSENINFTAKGPCESDLTTHNLQNERGSSSHAICHDIYRVDTVGLKNSNYAWKFMIFVNM